jgi:hypothetical protein
MPSSTHSYRILIVNEEQASASHLYQQKRLGAGGSTRMMKRTHVECSQLRVPIKHSVPFERAECGVGENKNVSRKILIP